MNWERIRERLDPLLNELQDRWDALPEDRQQLAQRIGAVVLVVLPLLIVVLPLLIGRVSAWQDVRSAQAQLEEMRQLERVVVRRGIGGVGKSREPTRQRDESLLGTLDGVARKLDISSNVQSMRPIKARTDDASDAVDVKLKSLVLEELVRFLYELEENQSGLSVRRLEIQRELKQDNFLRVNIEVVE